MTFRDGAEMFFHVFFGHFRPNRFTINDIRAFSGREISALFGTEPRMFMILNDIPARTENPACDPKLTPVL